MERAETLLDLHPWEIIVHYMDGDIRETVHSELAPCSNLEFLTRYLDLHKQMYGQIFVIN